jgi:hypothetical protein
MIIRIFIFLFFFLFSGLVSAVEVLDVKGKTFQFRTLDYEIPLKKKVIVYSSKKSKSGKRRKLAIGRIIKVEGKIYTAKVIKKYRKKEKLVEGLKIRISKRYRVKDRPSKDTAKKKEDSKDKGKSQHLNFLAKVRPLGVATGYYDAEGEFALKGSNKSFSLVVAYISLESNSKSVAGLGGIGKYNRYFSERAISSGFYLSGAFGMYIMTASGKASNGSIINVDLYVPYLGGTVGYQFIFNKKYSLSLGGGGGIYLVSSEVDTTAITGEDSTLEVPLSGFTPTIDLSFGMSF